MWRNRYVYKAKVLILYFQWKLHVLIAKKKPNPKTKQSIGNGYTWIEKFKWLQTEKNCMHCYKSWSGEREAARLHFRKGLQKSITFKYMKKERKSIQLNKYCCNGWMEESAHVTNCLIELKTWELSEYVW